MSASIYVMFWNRQKNNNKKLVFVLKKKRLFLICSAVIPSTLLTRLLD